MKIDPENAEKIIAENHAGDMANGFTEAQANESDAFERRVLGMDEDNYCGSRLFGLLRLVRHRKYGPVEAIADALIAIALAQAQAFTVSCFEASNADCLRRKS